METVPDAAELDEPEVTDASPLSVEAMVEIVTSPLFEVDDAPLVNAAAAMATPARNGGKPCVACT